MIISIHALLAESDTKKGGKMLCSLISIHALLAESDGIHTIWACTNKNFYPRSPCGERHGDLLTNKATAPISIHALLAESDGSDQQHKRHL